MTKHLTPLVFSFLITLLTHPTNAMDEGFYVGLNTGYSSFDFNHIDHDNYKGSWAANFFSGYNIVPFAGIEFGYGMTGKFSESGQTDGELTAETLRLGVSLWGELNQTIDIFNKIQYAHIKVINNDSDYISASGIYYEIGLQFYVLPGLSLLPSLSYTGAQKDDVEYQLIQGLLGAQFAF